MSAHEATEPWTREDNASAAQARGRGGRKMGKWTDWIMNGMPLLLLLGLWLFFMYKMRRGKTPWLRVYQKQAELLEEQTKVLRETNELLKRIAGSH
jgi:ATP-dependent Zn protease